MGREAWAMTDFRRSRESNRERIHGVGNSSKARDPWYWAHSIQYCLRRERMEILFYIKIELILPWTDLIW